MQFPVKPGGSAAKEFAEIEPQEGDVANQARQRSTEPRVWKGDSHQIWRTQRVQVSGTLGEISYSFFNGSSWSSSAYGPFAPSERLEFPALVVYQSDLYLFWVAQGGGTGYSTYNGSAWTSATSITGTWGSAVSVTGLGVAACDGDLFAAWVNGFSTAEQSIRYSDFDGSTWTKPVWSRDDGPSLGCQF